MKKFIERPSPNYFEDNSPILAVCLHGTASDTIEAALGWHQNPKSEVSANFHIDKLGNIYRVVNWEIGRRAWGNGVVETWDHSLKWLAELVKEKKNPNRYTVSIEHQATSAEMRAGASMTDAQFNSSIDLTAYILRRAGLKCSDQTVIGHFQISGRIKATCPGVIFPSAYRAVLLDRNPDLKP